MTLDGVYEAIMKTALGDQKTTLTVKTDGDRWTGSQASPQGSTEVTDGTIDGNTLKWISKISKPVSMTLKSEVTISGDSIAGVASAGVYGKFPITGTRIG
jgi:hypothetical protein